MVRSRRRVLAPWIPAASLIDLEQTVALRVIECLPRFRGLAGLESWIFAFCDGVVRNAGRRHRRHDALFPRLGPRAVAALAAKAPASHLDLHMCLDCLCAADRELVWARHWDGLRLDQVAARLGVCRNTVKSRYHRALKQLRPCLQRCRARNLGPGP
jgi:RNA polymerase sigma factor (sigma-70 family)